jgi:hypothetical protein
MKKNVTLTQDVCEGHAHQLQDYLKYYWRVLIDTDSGKSYQRLLMLPPHLLVEHILSTLWSTQGQLPQSICC